MCVINYIHVYKVSKGLQCALMVITIMALWQLLHLGHRNFRKYNTRYITMLMYYLLWATQFWPIQIEQYRQHTVFPFSVDLRIGEIAWSRAAVVPPLAVSNTKAVCWTLVMYGPGIMVVLPHQAGETITRAGTTVHGRDGRAGLCVVVHHGGWWLDDYTDDWYQIC